MKKTFCFLFALFFIFTIATGIAAACDDPPCEPPPDCRFPPCDDITNIIEIDTQHLVDVLENVGECQVDLETIGVQDIAGMASVSPGFEAEIEVLMQNTDTIDRDYTLNGANVSITGSVAQITSVKIPTSESNPDISVIAHNERNYQGTAWVDNAGEKIVVATRDRGEINFCVDGPPESEFGGLIEEVNLITVESGDQLVQTMTRKYLGGGNLP